MQRAMIIGPPGSGKTTLALALGERTGLPVVHVDSMFYAENWVLRAQEETTRRMLAVVRAESWIIEGNHSSTFDARAERADLLVWLDFPTGLCLRRVLARTWREHGRVRPSLPPGCRERFDLPFLHYVATFRLRKRRKVVKFIERTRGRLAQVILRDPHEVEGWLDVRSLGASPVGRGP